MKIKTWCFVLVIVTLGFCICKSQATTIHFFTDGVIKEPDVYADVGIWNDATVDMTGGLVTNDLVLRDQSTLNLSGGTTWSIYAEDSSTVNMTGGNLPGWVTAEWSWSGPNQALINIYGYSFNYAPDDGIADGGQLTGFWQDGTPFSMDFGDGPGSTYYDHVNLHVIPEPGTILLLGLGGVFLRRKRH